jgi:thiamine-phosphate pyrophosphorylase
VTLPRILLITDRRRTPRPLVEAVSLALSAMPEGSAAVMLREKDLSDRELFDLARSLRELCSSRSAPLFVNGRLDVALAARADGVHLGGDAPRYGPVRALVPHSMAVGLSIHGDELPPASASWAVFSPIFKPSSKPGAQPLGLGPLREKCAFASTTPIFALGGIEASNAASCLKAGAYGVAVLASVLQQKEPGEAAAKLHAAVAAA